MHHCLELTDSQFGFIGLNSANGKAMDLALLVLADLPAEQYD